jgi:hypothetical protein
MNHKFKIIYIILAIVLALFQPGCQKLAVDNPNDPDTEKALANPDDVESLMGGTYLTWYQGNLYESALPFSTLADELTSPWGNWGMGEMSREPRREYENSSTNYNLPMIARPWYAMYEVLSTAKDVWELLEDGIQIGENGANNLRMRAFIRFMQGTAHGELALIFDKGFIVDENTDLSSTPVFKTYSEIMVAAIGYLEQCIEICQNNSFELPDTWIYGVPATNEELAQIAHSYLARYLAGVARTPEERAAVDWAKVIQHADAGITSEFIIASDGNFWFDGAKYFGSRQDWCRADYKVIGHADTSGAFQEWLAAEPADRAPFIIHTADRRIAGADSTTAPGTDFSYNARYPFETYRASWYRSRRYIDHYFSGATSPVSIFNPAELRLLKAEGLYRQSDFAGAAEIVNETRVNRGGLKPINASDSALLDKIKYEKRIEIFLSFGRLMWIERRGWGELGAGAPLQFPIPATELEVLLEEIYTFGGDGGDWAAKSAAEKHWSRLVMNPRKITD